MPVDQKIVQTGVVGASAVATLVGGFGGFLNNRHTKTNNFIERNYAGPFSPLHMRDGQIVFYGKNPTHEKYLYWGLIDNRLAPTLGIPPNNRVIKTVLGGEQNVFCPRLAASLLEAKAKGHDVTNPYIEYNKLTCNWAYKDPNSSNSGDIKWWNGESYVDLKPPRLKDLKFPGGKGKSVMGEWQRF